MAAALPFAPAAGGVIVALRVTPRARRDAVAGIVTDADGTRRLKVEVTAAPEDGKANAAVVKLLAKAWRLPKGALAVTAGATGRRKLLHVAGDPATLTASLTDWLATVAK